MFTGKGLWRKSTSEDRHQAIEDALGVFERQHRKSRIFASVVCKSAASPRDALEVAFEQLASRFDRYLMRLHRGGDTRRGILIFDDSRHEADIQALARNFQVNGHTWGKICNFAEVPLFLDSIVVLRSNDTKPIGSQGQSPRTGFSWIFAEPGKAVPILIKTTISHLGSGLTQPNLETVVRREFEGKALKWGVAPHPTESQGFRSPLRKPCRLIQLADLIAYAVFRRFEHGDLRFFECIQSRFDTEGGIVHRLHTLL